MLTQLPIRLVCATRETKDSFFEKTSLGRMLSVFRFQGPIQIETRFFFQNSSGLSAVYNTAIREAESDPAILVFVHDDVCLCDFYWPDRIYDSLKSFDLVGLAGNKRRVPGQPSWAFIDGRFTWDALENLSGVVGHGRGYPCAMSVYGPPAQEVKLLDGLMLFCRSDLLHEKGLMFDERFTFHFYDLDLCRQAERKGIKMGTWSISAAHESSGSFGGDAWLQGYKTYLDKWID